MKNLYGKKLLILGGNPETIPLVEIANSYGIKTIVASARSTDPAKKFAWKAYTFEGLDVDAVIEIAKNEKVDGVLVGVADILVPMYCKVCKELNFPCYVTEEIVNVFSFKDTFKRTCEKYGINGIPEYNLQNSFSDADVKNVKFPVMIKPVDNGGGVGMTVANNVNELREGISIALNASNLKRYIIEKYMQCDDMGMYFTFKDGYCSASCIYDRYTTNEQPGLSKVCLGGTYPSKHIDEYFKILHPKLLKMFEDIGIKNGVLMLSGFFENNEFYLYDTGFRLQGEAPHIIMKAVNGFDQREMLINFALTGSEGDIDLKKVDDVMLKGKSAATLWFLLKEGTISSIIGLDDIKNDKNVVANIQRLYVGDTVLKEWIGNEKQVLTRLYLVTDSKKELAEKLKYYMNIVKVYDEYGNNMLLSGFDVDKALL